jgi:hypothetical protein
MVRDTGYMLSSTAHPFVVEEQFIASKTGRMETCEDALYIGSHYVAVIDGATSKTDRRWNGETGGRMAAKLIVQTLETVPYDATAQQAIDGITATIQQFYREQDALESVIAEPVQRLIAAVVIVSFFRHEVWFVGDCQCLLGRKHIQPRKQVDMIAAEARAMYLETELLRGATIEALRQHDTGRDFILPLLQRQSLFQNKPESGAYAYSVIDGFSVPAESIITYQIPESVRTIVLASDGYPILRSSLRATEQALQLLLREDPLLFRAYKSTKGLQEGNCSFDDRTYVKLRLSGTSL